MLRSFYLFGLAFTVVLMSGCALRYYDVTLTNGTVIGAKGRPKHDGGYYVFTDMQGKGQSVPEYRISEIAPHVDKKKKSPFNNYGAK
jgi:hypothetical protein